MKKKGSRFLFRTVACLAVVSNAAFAAGADEPADDRAAADQARIVQAIRAERRAREAEEEKSWLLATTTGDGSATGFAPAGGLFLASVAPVPQGAPTVPTSGTLSTATSQNYSTAPWVITAGDGSYPGAGGVATFNEQVGTTPGTFPAVPVITLDVAVTLSGLTFNSVYQYILATTSSFTLALTTTGTNTLSVPISNFSSPTLFVAGDVISAPISGGGTYGLTKTGAGSITLASTNTYTGGTFINGGTLRSSVGDSGLGATGSGNDVTLNGGTLFLTNTAFTSARNFTIGSNNGALQLFTTAALSGVVGGSGNLTVFGGSALTLTGANTLTGSTTLQSGGSITLSGTGTLAATSALDLTGTLVLTDSTTNVNNRLGTAVPVTSRGATVTLTGNTTASSTETTGTYTLTAGNSLITLTPKAGGTTVFDPASFARQNNSTLFVRGTSLGAAAAASVAQINPATGPSLVGGGGAAGTTTISIVPWMVGNVGGTAVYSSNLVTYTSATGLRPLTSTEYANTFTGATSATNVSVATTTLPNSATTVNALLLTGPGVTALATGGTSSVLNINSGALLYSPSTNTPTTISANLNFGTAEGIISSSNTTGTLTLSGVISGSGGLTLNDFGNTSPGTTAGNFAMGTANTYTGTTTLLNGTTTFTGTITNDGTTPSAFGEATTPIVINAGVAGARLYAAASGAIINRDLTVSGAASGTVGLGTVGSYALTMNGNIILNRPLTLEAGGGTATTAFTINGNISGTGYLTDDATFLTYNILSGNNTYSGGTNIYAGTYAAGSDTAFGTGTIYSGSSNAGTILGTGTALRTLANSFTFENGTAVTFNFAGAAPLNLTGGINLNGTTSLTFTNTGGTTFSGVVANGGLMKAGAQTLTLSNANTYTGGTVISAGTVFATNASGSGTGSGAISVTAGTLGGTGFIVNTVPTGSTAATTSLASGAIIEGGTGAATGALTLNGNLTLVSGAIIELGLSNTNTNSSLTRAGGIWVLPTGTKFTFTGSPTTGDSYNGIITGLAADPGTEGGWTITNSGFTGNFYYDGLGDINLLPVPEPATVFGGLACVALLGWHLRGRPKRPAEAAGRAGLKHYPASRAFPATPYGWESPASPGQTVAAGSHRRAGIGSPPPQSTRKPA